MREIPAITKAGDCVSINQLESLTPGLIAQLQGFLTKEHYNCAMVFVDHHSKLSYLHLQQSTGTEETIRAKEPFEAWAATHGVIIQHYNANNGCFTEQAFCSHCKKKGQMTPFCGVNTHHWNGMEWQRKDMRSTGHGENNVGTHNKEVARDSHSSTMALHIMDS